MNTSRMHLDNMYATVDELPAKNFVKIIDKGNWAAMYRDGKGSVTDAQKQFLEIQTEWFNITGGDKEIRKAFNSRIELIDLYWQWQEDKTNIGLELSYLDKLEELKKENTTSSRPDSNMASLLRAMQRSYYTVQIDFSKLSVEDLALDYIEFTKQTEA